MNVIEKNPNDLIPYENNAKDHPQSQVDDIALQIKEFGFDQPIVINSDNVIIKGHGRRLAALQLGLDKVPVIVKNVSENEARAMRLGDNKVAEADWVSSFLKTEFEFLKEHNFDLNLTGFKQHEIDLHLNGWKADFDAIKRTGENLDGLSAIIKIHCPQEMKLTLKEFLDTQIQQSGFEGVEIEA